MENVKFTLLLWAKETNGVFFRDCMDSVLAQTYQGWELIILDENSDMMVSTIVTEFFPRDERIQYRRLQKGWGLSYALNLGASHGTGDYIVFMGQHDRINEHALMSMAEEISKHHPDLVYYDHDELVGANRTNPHFKSDLNIELLRQVDYIGDFLCIRRSLYLESGGIRSTLDAAGIYDLLLRAVEKKWNIRHIPRLLYHLRISGDDLVMTKEMTEAAQKAYREYITVAEAHLARMGLPAKVHKDRHMRFWRVSMDGSDYRNHRKEYILVKDKKIRVLNRKAMDILYGYLRQEDVGVVGVRFVKNGFLIDNCGYIYDRQGIAYPACYNQSVFSEGYDYRMMLPRDVSMVDADYCLIDERVYRGVGGFDPKLTGRDIMLDFCLKVRRANRRVVYVPMVTARKSEPRTLSDQASNEYLMAKWKDVLPAGDPYYNRNLPMGLENYFLY